MYFNATYFNVFIFRRLQLPSLRSLSVSGGQYFNNPEIFSKIHGLGTQIFLTYPSLYKVGGNFTLEAIYRSVQMFLERRNVKQIRTLYIQLDNATSNKCWTLFAGLAALISLGIVQKVSKHCGKSSGGPGSHA